MANRGNMEETAADAGAQSASLRVDTATGEGVNGRWERGGAVMTVAATAPAEKGSNEWTSSRSRGRRGTPPPMPRRGSKSGDETAGSEDPPRPRTPAQVLASRAHTTAAPTVAAVKNELAGGTEHTGVEEAKGVAVSVSSGVDELRKEAVEPESAAEKEEVETANGGGRERKHEYGVVEEGAIRRVSVHLSAVSESYASDADSTDVYGRYRREERVDTSTVDEESMYNEEDEEGEYEGEEEGSEGTSDEYVNIHEQADGDYQEEDEQVRQATGGDESLTPDSTPPPSPARPIQAPPPPATSDWIKYVAESGHEYYYNSKTHVSQWTRPASLGLSSPTNATRTSMTDEQEENQTHTQDEPGGFELATTDAPDASVVSRSTRASYLDSLFATAAKNDETAQLQDILHYNTDVNAMNASGLTPLHVAVQHGNARGAQMLLDYGALVDGPGFVAPMTSSPDVTPHISARAIETPLVMACRTNHASIVRLLVRYGASIYARDFDGNSVLHIAIRCWSDEVLSCLLEMDSVAAIINLRNAEDETPLHLAARHGNAVAVRQLLETGASSDVEDAHGRTPLVVSIMENRVECAQLLQAAHRKSLPSPQPNLTKTNDAGPVLYDYKSEELKEEDFSVGQTSLELDGLGKYLHQLVQHSAADHVLLSTTRHYIASVQREIDALRTSIKNLRLLEENLIGQIDLLTNNHSVTANELAKEREENERLHHENREKEIKLTSLQAAHESLASRASMLESIARSAQEKLRRERAEHMREEQYWTQTIESSLRENAELLSSLKSLHEGWKGHSQYDAGHGNNEMQEEYQDPSVSSVGYSGDLQYTAYPALGYSDASDSREHYMGYAIQEAHGVSANVNDYPYAQHNTQETSSHEVPVSSDRVDAVWNRFFENMSRAAEVGNASIRPISPRAVSLMDPQSKPMMADVLPPASAVFGAIRRGDKDRLHQLLLSGISPNSRDIGEKGTPLHLASELGDLDAVMLLCEFGADFEIRDENGNTPLLVCCSQGHYDCTKFLLQSAANQAARNSTRDSALHLAAWDGSYECVEILLEYGVDVLARNSLGLTALANIKTRSPLRQRFSDLANDHPMARTLALLEEAETEERSGDDGLTATTRTTDRQVPTESNASEKSTMSSAQSTPVNTSWGRWILTFVFGSSKNSAPVNQSEDSDDQEDESEEDATSAFEDAIGGSTNATSSLLRKYEELRPPPEVEAALRSIPASPTLTALPPPPTEVLHALEKHNPRGSAGEVISPTHSAARFASPTSSAGTKNLSPQTPTSVRSRYVDTFNA